MEKLAQRSHFRLDTLGAGEGWAGSIMFNPALADQFKESILRIDRGAITLTRLGNYCGNLLPVRFHHAVKAFKIIKR